MNKLESKGHKIFWFVLLLSIFPYVKRIAIVLYYYEHYFSEAQMYYTAVDLTEALTKIAIFTTLFFQMDKGRIWAKHLFAGLIIILLIVYYGIPVALGDDSFYPNLSIAAWKTRVTNTVLYSLLPIILLYVLTPIKAFLQIRSNQTSLLAKKIDTIGS